MEEQQPPSGAAPMPSQRGKGLWVAVAVVVVVVAVLLAAVFGGLLGGGVGVEERTLRLGTVLSITGGLAAFGPFNQRGVQMAVDEINAAGGVLGNFIQAFHQNDDSKPDTARSAATTLVAQNRVDAIIGATGSGQCSTVLEVAKANSVFEISGSCTSPRFSNTTLSGGWWARTSPSDALQGVVAAHYAQENRTWARAAVIGINNAYGVALAQVFHDNFIRFGGQMVTANPRIVTEVQFGATDYTGDLRAVLNTNPAPQVLYVVAYPPDAILLVQNFEAVKNAEGWTGIQLLFSEGVFDQTQFLDVLAGAPNNFDISGFLGTAPSPFGGVRGPGYADWEADYIAKWCIETGTPAVCQPGGDLDAAEPRLFDDNNYDAAYLVALAAQAAGRATGDGIRSKIRDVANPPGLTILPGEWSKAVTEIAAGRDVDYEGASGSVNIDEFGDPFSGYVVWGVDAADEAINVEIYPESLVNSILPSSSPPLEAWASQGLGQVWAPEARSRRES